MKIRFWSMEVEIFYYEEFDSHRKEY
jgi:hypothetical protein